MGKLADEGFIDNKKEILLSIRGECHTLGDFLIYNLVTFNLNRP